MYLVARIGECGQRDYSSSMGTTFITHCLFVHPCSPCMMSVYDIQSLNSFKSSSHFSLQPVKKKPAESAEAEAPPTEKPKSAPPKKKPAAAAALAVAASGGGAKGKGKGKGKKGGGTGPMFEPPDQPEPNIAVSILLLFVSIAWTMCTMDEYCTCMCCVCI